MGSSTRGKQQSSSTRRHEDRNKEAVAAHRERRRERKHTNRPREDIDKIPQGKPQAGRQSSREQVAQVKKGERDSTTAPHEKQRKERGSREDRKSGTRVEEGTRGSIHTDSCKAQAGHGQQQAEREE